MKLWERGDRKDKKKKREGWQKRQKLISVAGKTNTILTRSHLSLNSLLSRLLDYGRDYVESDVGCSRKKDKRVSTPP